MEYKGAEFSESIQPADTPTPLQTQSNKPPQFSAMKSFVSIIVSLLLAATLSNAVLQCKTDAQCVSIKCPEELFPKRCAPGYCSGGNCVGPVCVRKDQKCPVSFFHCCLVDLVANAPKGPGVIHDNSARPPCTFASIIYFIQSKCLILIILRLRSALHGDLN